MTDPSTPDIAVTHLWQAVNSLTKPTTRKVERGQLEVEMDLWLRGPRRKPVMCDVAAYRAAMTRHGEVPSLWEQAEEALTTGREQQEGGGVPKAARSPADLDLMEIMLTIRESMSAQISGRTHPRTVAPCSCCLDWTRQNPKPTIPAQIRHLAAHVTGYEPQNVEWWAYRFGQWARLLNVYLRALETGPKAVRLRGLRCPECHVTTTLVDTDQGEVVAPPIIVDFVNGWIRAAQCTACGQCWWRGQDLWDLAATQAYDTPNHGPAANTA